MKSSILKFRGDRIHEILPKITEFINLQGGDQIQTLPFTKPPEKFKINQQLL
jgi:hypothetical protein